MMNEGLEKLEGQALPCPFCGNIKATLENDGRGHWRVDCGGCSARGPALYEEGTAIVMTPSLAVELWNERPGDLNVRELWKRAEGGELPHPFYDNDKMYCAICSRTEGDEIHAPFV